MFLRVNAVAERWNQTVQNMPHWELRKIPKDCEKGLSFFGIHREMRNTTKAVTSVMVVCSWTVGSWILHDTERYVDWYQISHWELTSASKYMRRLKNRLQRDSWWTQREDSGALWTFTTIYGQRIRSLRFAIRWRSTNGKKLHTLLTCVFNKYTCEFSRDRQFKCKQWHQRARLKYIIRQ